MQIYLRFSEREYFRNVASEELSLLGTDVQTNHSEEHKSQVESLCLEVFLVEEGSTKEETDDNRTAAHHGDDGNHRIGQ